MRACDLMVFPETGALLSRFPELREATMEAWEIIGDWVVPIAAEMGW